MYLKPFATRKLSVTRNPPLMQFRKAMFEDHKSVVAPLPFLTERVALGATLILKSEWVRPSLWFNLGFGLQVGQVSACNVQRSFAAFLSSHALDLGSALPVGRLLRASAGRRKETPPLRNAVS
jgi:hypothetical protein